MSYTCISIITFFSIHSFLLIGFFYIVLNIQRIIIHNAFSSAISPPLLTHLFPFYNIIRDYLKLEKLRTHERDSVPN